MKTILRLGLGLAVLLAPTVALADMAAGVLPPWDGKKVPAGQQCSLFGGKGATPPMMVTGIPKGAKWIIAEFNDKSYSPLSSRGGHGIVAWPVKGTKTKLFAVPGMKSKLPGGARLIKPARSTGKYKSNGYLPPCSGGKGNRYTVDLKAVDANGKVLDKVRNLSIGRY
ncbi:hypothetical protein RXV86_07230 [Alisedimentitalea sp. MJ-SS2]|uniref:hypothetical protein n=1 Tax=Aliisedimentitalea sp. MJ-SS2 TaxID=3049795 RepID=UPI0029154CD8|nr:hypothetical protein [Alisedimentitalea sp. MJ-SS2]MDU8927171.1 hypothetical protein [Alisedimentitalea sp. MJ-SS2]